MRKLTKAFSLVLVMILSLSVLCVSAEANSVFTVANGEFDAKGLNTGEEITIPVTVNNLPAPKIYAAQLDFAFNKALLEFTGLEAVMMPAVDEETLSPLPASWVFTPVETANSTGKIVAAFLDTTMGSLSLTPVSIEKGTDVLFNLKFKVLNNKINTLVELTNVLMSDYSTGAEVKLTLNNGDMDVKAGKVIFEDGKIILLPDTKEPNKPAVKPAVKPEQPKEEVTDSATLKFTDLEGFQWAQEAIYELVGKGIVNGKSETSYDPASNVTRAEFAKLIVAAFEMESDAESAAYTDVNENDWFNSYVAIASSKGIVKGYEDGTFKPDANITREEMCVMLERALKGYELETKESSFADAELISDWAKSAVDLLSANGIINGKEGNVFAPADSANRAESAVAIFRTLKNALNK